MQAICQLLNWATKAHLISWAYTVNFQIQSYKAILVHGLEALNQNCFYKFPIQIANVIKVDYDESLRPKHSVHNYFFKRHMNFLYP